MPGRSGWIRCSWLRGELPAQGGSKGHWCCLAEAVDEPGAGQCESADQAAVKGMTRPSGVALAQVGPVKLCKALILKALGSTELFQVGWGWERSGQLGVMLSDVLFKKLTLVAMWKMSFWGLTTDLLSEELIAW